MVFSLQLNYNLQANITLFLIFGIKFFPFEIRRKYYGEYESVPIKSAERRTVSSALFGFI